MIWGPLLALAQTPQGQNTYSAGFGNVGNSIYTIKGIINSLIPLIIGVAVLVFLWGLVQYVTAGADEEKKAAARGIIIYGIIIIFVMTAVWGFVGILGSTLFPTGVTTQNNTYPQV